MDDRVTAKVEVIVSCGARSGILCSVSREGVFVCDHPDLDIMSRLVSAGEVALSAQPRPGKDHVRVSVGEKLGVVMIFPKVGVMIFPKVGQKKPEPEPEVPEEEVPEEEVPEEEVPEEEVPEEEVPEEEVPEEVTLHVQESRPARKRRPEVLEASGE